MQEVHNQGMEIDVGLVEKEIKSIASKCQLHRLGPFGSLKLEGGIVDIVGLLLLRIPQNVKKKKRNNQTTKQKKMLV